MYAAIPSAKAPAQKTHGLPANARNRRNRLSRFRTPEYPTVQTANQTNFTERSALISGCKIRVSGHYFSEKYSIACANGTGSEEESARHFTFMTPESNSFPPMTATYSAPILSANLNCALTDRSM